MPFRYNEATRLTYLMMYQLGCQALIAMRARVILLTVLGGLFMHHRPTLELVTIPIISDLRNDIDCPPPPQMAGRARAAVIMDGL